MPRHPVPSRPRLRCSWLAACLLALGGCDAREPGFAQLSGLMLDGELTEVSGIAASRAHPGVLWAANDGGNAAALYAISPRGSRLGKYPIDGVRNTDWEDLAAFDLAGRHYLLIADTGDNGGLRKTVQLHVIEEPARLRDGTALKPAWSLTVRWPDGARDCEAAAVDAAGGNILLVSKKREPPELFAVPLRAGQPGSTVTARRVGLLAGVPHASAQERAADPRMARVHGHVSAADLSPDGRMLAVMTYRNVLFYARAQGAGWADAVAARPRVFEVPALIPQPEALAWSVDGQRLYATGEFSPAPVFILTPPRN